MGDESRETGRRAAGRGGAKKRMRSKSAKRTTKLSPLQERLKDTDCYLNHEMERILGAPTTKDRLLLISSLLSEDVTDISRVWPNQLRNKDSRIRRELSEQGSEHFLAGENDLVLEYYNRAVMYSSGKGIAHTLARRAAFFLSTGEPNLALRDLSTALEYGCLHTELMDFLLSHHTPNRTGKPQISTKYKWAENIRAYLDAAAVLKSNQHGGDGVNLSKDELLRNIMTSIETAAKEANIETNLEVRELELPEINERNPLIPAFSESAAVCYDPEKGRTIKARRDIKAGELICVDSPICSILCPDKPESISSHCTQCFRFTRAPLPCDNCCSVVFCSKECKTIGLQTYHRYECQMKLYEMFEYEGRDVFGLFMALRAVTQKPLQYFSEKRLELEKFMDRSVPVHPLPGRAYLSSDYRTLTNLETHKDDLDDDVMVKHSVLAVFFVRFLKFAGYFGNTGKPKLEKGKPVMDDMELFMLRYIYQLINIQAFNSHSVFEMSSMFEWSKVGTSINPSMALVNHSCDSNTIRCSLNKNSILVAGRHIPEGEEITDSYTVHFRSSTLDQRQYHTLKYFMFACECPACAGKWPLEDDIPDELPRIPNFEQEVVYVNRQGDKKEIVRDIIKARQTVEANMLSKKFEDTILAYQSLCEQLEKHVRKPHAFFLQARSGISHCLWNMYCKQKVADDEEDETEDITGRDQAVNIYKSDFVESVKDNEALNLGESAAVVQEESDEMKEERRKMIELAKHTLANSSLALGQLKADNKDMLENVKALKELSTEHALLEKVSRNVLSTAEISRLIDHQEKEVEAMKKDLENFHEEVKAKELVIKERRKQERQEEEKNRAYEMEEKRKKKEQELQKKLDKMKEEEAQKKELRLQAEEKKKKEKEQIYKKKQEEAIKLFEEAQQKRKQKLKEEEDELEMLLAMVAEDAETTNEIFDPENMLLPMESQDKDFVQEMEGPEIMETSAEDGEIITALMLSSLPVNLDDLASSNKIPDTASENLAIMTKVDVDNNTKNKDGQPELKHEQTEAIDILNNDFSNVEKNSLVKDSEKAENLMKVPFKEEEENVWKALREIKQNDTFNVNLMLNHSTSGDTLDEDDFDLYILELKKKALEKKVEAEAERERRKIAAEQREFKKKEEKFECIKEEKNESDSMQIEEIEKVENVASEPFDYEAWSAKINTLFSDVNAEESKVLAQDQAYLAALKQKINENIKIDLEKNKKNEIISKPPLVVKPKPNSPKIKDKNGKKVDDYESLKNKDKERKRKKKEEKFKQAEEKMKDMSLKTIKIDKIATEAEQEIMRMKEMAKKMVLKSRTNERDFDEIFTSLVELDTKHEENKPIAKNNLEEDEHWTEQEKNKWPAQTKTPGFSNALSMLKVAAHGQTELVETLKGNISNAQKNIPKPQLSQQKEKPKELVQDLTKISSDLQLKQDFKEEKISSSVKDSSPQVLLENDILAKEENLFMSNKSKTHETKINTEKTNLPKLVESSAKSKKLPDIEVKQGNLNTNGISSNAKKVPNGDVLKTPAKAANEKKIENFSKNTVEKKNVEVEKKPTFIELKLESTMKDLKALAARKKMSKTKTETQPEVFAENNVKPVQPIETSTGHKNKNGENIIPAKTWNLSESKDPEMMENSEKSSGSNNLKVDPPVREVKIDNPGLEDVKNKINVVKEGMIEQTVVNDAKINQTTMIDTKCIIKPKADEKNIGSDETKNNSTSTGLSDFSGALKEIKEDFTTVKDLPENASASENMKVDCMDLKNEKINKKPLGEKNKIGVSNDLQSKGIVLNDEAGTKAAKNGMNKITVIKFAKAANGEKEKSSLEDVQIVSTTVKDVEHVCTVEKDEKSVSTTVKDVQIVSKNVKDDKGVKTIVKDDNSVSTSVKDAKNVSTTGKDSKGESTSAKDAKIVQKAEFDVKADCKAVKNIEIDKKAVKIVKLDSKDLKDKQVDTTTQSNEKGHESVPNPKIDEKKTTTDGKNKITVIKFQKSESGGESQIRKREDDISKENKDIKDKMETIDADGTKENYQILKVPTQVVIFPSKSVTQQVQSTEEFNPKIDAILNVDSISKMSAAPVPAVKVSRPPPPKARPPPPPLLL